MGRYDRTKKSTKPTGLLMVAGLMLLLAGGAWYYLTQEPGVELTEPSTQALALPNIAQESALTDASAPTELADADIEIKTSKPLDDRPFAEEEDIVKANLPVAAPTLENSDNIFRESLLGVSPTLNDWLQADHLIRRFITLTHDFSQGLSVPKHMRFLRLSQPFAVDREAIAGQDTQRMVIAASSYQRYDALAAAVNAMNVQSTLSVYKKFRPLFKQVFNEFGYPADFKLENIFIKAAAEVLEAPIIEEKITLVRPSVFYKFEDNKLESLNPVQRQMLRMGPKNTRIIQNKVRQLVEGLISVDE